MTFMTFSTTGTKNTKRRYTKGIYQLTPLLIRYEVKGQSQKKISLGVSKEN